MTDSESITHLMHRQPESRFAACSSDACRQGRDKCPCPSACEVPGQDMQDLSAAIGEGACILFALLCLACAVAPAFL